MRLAYIKWRDAVHEDADHSSSNVPQLTVLEEVGWLLGESQDAILLGMELQPEGMAAGRSRFHIPRSNIIEMRVVEFAKAFPKKSVTWRAT